MVLTAGITPSNQLSTLFESTTSITNKTRIISVRINDETTQLVLLNEGNSNGQTDDQEFNTKIEQVFDSEKPQYILYETDEKKWLQILYLPDTKSSAKDKMVYAATQATLKEAFGNTRISEQFSVTSSSDMSWQKIKEHHLDKGNTEDLLSNYEKGLQAAKREEELTRSLYMKEGTHGIQSGALNFTFSSDAKTAVDSFRDGHANFVTLKLNMQKEVFEVLNSESVSDYSLVSGKVVEDKATYNLLHFVHESGKFNILFVCMPSKANMTVKERMLNASCRNGVISTLAEMGVAFQFTPQIDDGSEVSFLELERIVAPEVESKTGFVKKTVGRPGKQRPGSRPARVATRNEAVDL